ncbi:MAG: class I SAM-dependent methyltransferase [Candidatus Omnitrophica bacterium]|nr:class I SAM-dependent methyltransferase [Candidatus Omnitrophota bacterium]
MKKCLLCGSSVEPFLSFGPMPRANGFLRLEEFEREYFFPLEAAFCPGCAMVQITEQPEPERMFNASYPFFTGSSRRMALHFEEFAKEAARHLPPSSNPLVVEIGSNDGTMLACFAGAGMRHLGVEPSLNAAQAARDRGLKTVSEFFTLDLARRIVQDEGRADTIVAANVMCHIRDLHSALDGVRLLLKPRGLFWFEDPYVGDVLEKTAYDQIYDEHAYLFSVSSISRLLKRHGLEVVDVQPMPTHGGSNRFTAAHRGALPVSRTVAAFLEREKRLELHHRETYDRFRKRCEESRDRLTALLKDLRRAGKRVVGYGATSKSTTVINYCGITTDLMEFICDTTPLKQGTFSPGAHIPVRSHEQFLSPYPDYALLFAWNHRDEIMEKEGGFREKGGRWILYVPTVGLSN